MATGTLRTKNYGNRYVAMREELAKNPFFNEQDWISVARGNHGDVDLDMYITTLLNSDKIEDVDKFYTDYNYEYADSKTRVASLYNEIFANKNNIDTIRERYVTNELGVVQKDENGKPLVEKFKASDYDYYKSIIKQENDFLYQAWLTQQEQERKDSMNAWAKFGLSILGVGSEAVSGVVNTLDGVISFFGGLADGVSAMIKGEDFSDAFVQGTSSDKYRLLQGLEDWLLEFESRYTGLRDINGNYTNIGKYVGGVSYSLGQMLPSMLLSKGVGMAAKGSKAVATVGNVSSQLLFYTGITGNNIRDMYNYFASEGVTAPTAAILANAGLKSALEFGVEIGLGKLMGGTAIDDLVFGRSVSAVNGKSLAGAAIKRILKDAGQEGLEEVLQDTASFLVDRAFMLLVNENFGGITELTPQSVFDAFVIGSISSIAGAARNVIMTRGKAAKEAGFTGFGKRLKYYEYGLNMQSFLENYEAVMKYHKDIHYHLDSKAMKEELSTTTNTSKNQKLATAALAEMYASFRLIASLYNEIGEERVKAADAILTQITYDLHHGKFDLDKVQNQAKNLYNSVFSKDTSMLAEALKKIEEAEMTELIAKLESDDVDLSEVLDEDAIDTLKKIIDGSKDVEEIVVTKDGNKPLKIAGKILIPERLAKNADASVTMYSIAEQSLVDKICNMSYSKIKIPLNDVLDTFKKLTGREDATLEDAVYSLVLDPNLSLYKTMLIVSNRDMLNLLTGLISVSADAEASTVQDALFVKKVSSIVTKMKSALTNYLKAQQHANESLYSHVLSEAQINSIRKERWTKDIYNRVVQGDVLSDADMRVLRNRVAYSSLSESVKQLILDNIKSSKRDLRLAAMNVLNLAYDKIFTSKYDGVTYMPMTSIPNSSFNTYLQNIDKTLQTLLSEDLSDSDREIVTSMYGEVTAESIESYRNKQFKDATNGLYVFKVGKDGKFSVVEAKTNKRVGYSNYSSLKESIYSGMLVQKDGVKYARTTATLASKSDSLINSILREDIDNATKNFISITDAINDTSLLSDEVLSEIKSNYKTVSPETALLYLHEHFLEATDGNIGLTVLPNNTYSFVNMSEMNSLLKAKDVKITKESTISDIIKKKHLFGRLADIKIKYAKSVTYNGKYEADSNTIYLNDKLLLKSNEKLLRYTILHEFQHAIQVEQGMNIGFGDFTQYLKPSTLKKMISDLKKHMPHLFKDRTDDVNILESYVYDTSGESMATGMLANVDIVDFYPTIISQENGQVTITFPWGTSYSLDFPNKNGMALLTYVENKSYEERLKNFTKELDYDSFRKNPVSCFIMPDGTLRTFGKDEHHYTIIEKISNNYTDENFQQYFDGIPQVSIQKDGNEYFASVRISGYTTRSANDMLLMCMDTLYAKNIEFDIGAIYYEDADPYDTVIFSDEADNSDDLLTLYNRTRSSNKVNRGFPSLAKIPALSKTVQEETEKVVDKKATKKASTPKRKQTPEEKEVEKELKKRYVTQKEAAGNNLKYFVGKYKKVQMAPELKEFIIITTGMDLPEELQDKISGKHKGTLVVADVMDYFRNTKTTDIPQHLFNAINDAFFKNDVIKTPEQLSQYMDMTADFYAARVILRLLNPDLITEDNVNISLRLIKNIQSLKEDDKLRKKYDEIHNRYFYKSFKVKDDVISAESLDINEKYLKWLWMSRFDGSINSGAQIANISRFAAKLNWSLTGSVKTTDINKSIGEDITLQDTLEDKSAYQSMLDGVENFGLSEKREMVLLWAGKYIRNRFGSNNNSIQNFKTVILKLSELSDKELNKLVVKTIVSQLTGISIEKLDELKISNKVEQNVENVERPGSAIVNNINSLLNTPNRKLNLTQKKLLVKHNSELFELTRQRLHIRRDVLDKYMSWSNGKKKYTDVKGLNELWDTVRNIVNEVKSGDYDNSKAYARAEAHRKTIKKILSNVNEKVVKETIVKEKVIEVHVSDSVLEFKSDMPMPTALEKLLDFEFSKPVKTRVQKFSTDDETHMQASYRTFLSENAERLEALTQDDVNSIIDFYLHSQISELNISEEKYRLYEVTKGWILAYLLRGNKLGWFILNDTQYDDINKHLSLRTSMSAQILQAHRTAMQIVNPEKIIIDSLAKSVGIEFAEEDITSLAKAVESGDITKIQAAKKKMYNDALKRYNGRKGTFMSRLLQFERVCMLSSPGTWVRNWTSNAIIGGVYVGDKQVVKGLLDTAEGLGNKASKLLRKLFPNKKWFNERKGQYKIIGTKVTTEVKEHIDKNLIQNKLLSEICEGLGKYNPARASKTTGTNELVDSIAKNIATKIFYAPDSNLPFLDKYYKFVYDRLSDDKSIQKRMLSYLGKMLVEDSVDVSKLDKTEFYNYVSEAYTLAADDFMHRPNVFAKFEADLFRKAPKPVYFAYKQFFPFASASWNWFAEALKYNPIVLIKSIINYANLESRIDKMDESRRKGEGGVSSKFAEYMAIRDVGKGVIGTIGTLVGCLLAAFGVVRLDEEDDKYKLKCGDVFVDISDVFGTQPIFLAMSTTQSIMDAMKQSDEDGSKIDFAAIIASTIDTMFVDSIFTDLYNTFRYNDGIGEIFMMLPEKTLNAIVPNFLKTITSITNVYNVKYSSGVLGKIEKLAANSIPGLAYAFPKYIDPYTGENQIMYKAPVLTDLINKLTPLGISVYNVSETEKKAIELGVNKSMLSGTYTINNKKIYLSAKEIEELNKYYGNLNKLELERLMSDSVKYTVKTDNGKYKELTYSQMNDKQKAAVIDRIMTDNSSYSKVYILSSKGYTYYASGSEYNRLRELGIDNVYKKTNTKEGFISP